MIIKTYDIKGKETGKEKFLALKKKPRKDLIYFLNRVVNLGRLKSSQTKTKGERRGGGIKPWRQKGTGRARVGSNRSPIWRKGGVTFGPAKEKNFKRKINRKSRKIAKNYLLGEKMNLGEVIIWQINPKEAAIKTKEAEQQLLKLPLKEGRALMLTSKKESYPGFYNLAYLDIKDTNNLSALDPLKYKIIILTESAFKQMDKEKNAKSKN